MFRLYFSSNMGFFVLYSSYKRKGGCFCCCSYIIIKSIDKNEKKPSSLLVLTEDFHDETQAHITQDTEDTSFRAASESQYEWPYLDASNERPR